MLESPQQNQGSLGISPLRIIPGWAAFHWGSAVPPEELQRHPRTKPVNPVWRRGANFTWMSKQHHLVALGCQGFWGAKARRILGQESLAKRGPAVQEGNVGQRKIWGQEWGEFMHSYFALKLKENLELPRIVEEGKEKGSREKKWLMPITQD